MQQPSPNGLHIVADDPPAPHPIDIICDMLRESEGLPRLMETFYLAQEPGLLEIMRALISLPEDERFRLLQYLSRCRDQHIYVREMPGGALVIDTVERSGIDESD